MEASLFNSLQLLIRFWENSSEPWGVKDNQSRYVYANNRLHRLLALPDKFNMEGRTDIVMKIRSLTMFLRASSNTQVHSH